MATVLAKAYVQIVPTARGIQGGIEKELSGEVKQAGISSGKAFGSELVSTLKKVIVAAGIGKIIQSALSEGAKLQQSYGGLDTIYGDASLAMQNYAQMASKAGISANDYAEQAVSFGAALKQTFGGDVYKAAQAADVAILDMADNAAKMGTPLESIQNAYQGFAKQNYTMLDNLKLGYGGTKKEMERLLADAQKITGVKYDISNLGDVYNAIHVIQGELGIAGVAAKEASETFSGSLGAVKASFQNLLGALTTGTGLKYALESLIGNAGVFIKNNLIPMITQIVEQIPTVVQLAIPLLVSSAQELITSLGGLIQGGGPQILENLKALSAEIASGLNTEFLVTGAQTIVSFVSGLMENIPELLETGAEIVSNLITGVLSAIPDIVVAAGTLITGLISAWFDARPEIFETGHNLIVEFITGLLATLPDLITTVGEMIVKMVNVILTNAPQFLEQGINYITQMISGILQSLPSIIAAITHIIVMLLATIATHLPEILTKGIEIITNICTGIIRSIPDAINAITEVTKNIIEEFKKVDWASLGKHLIDTVSEAIRNAVQTILDAVTDVGHQMMDAFTNIDWLSVGTNIVTGIKDGLLAAGGMLFNACRSLISRALNAAEDEADIGSPSRLFAREVGQWIPKGIAVGILDNVGAVESAMQSMTQTSMHDIGNAMRSATANITAPAASYAGLEERVDYLTALLVKYLPECAQPPVIDSDALTRTINRQLGVAYL